MMESLQFSFFMNYRYETLSQQVEWENFFFPWDQNSVLAKMKGAAGCQFQRGAYSEY